MPFNHELPKYPNTQGNPNEERPNAKCSAHAEELCHGVPSVTAAFLFWTQPGLKPRIRTARMIRGGTAIMVGGRFDGYNSGGIDNGVT